MSMWNTYNTIFLVTSHNCSESVWERTSEKRDSKSKSNPTVAAEDSTLGIIKAQIK